MRREAPLPLHSWWEWGRLCFCTDRHVHRSSHTHIFMCTDLRSCIFCYKSGWKQLPVWKEVECVLYSSRRICSCWKNGVDESLECGRSNPRRKVGPWRAAVGLRHPCPLSSVCCNPRHCPVPGGSSDRCSVDPLRLQLSAENAVHVRCEEAPHSRLQMYIHAACK